MDQQAADTSNVLAKCAGLVINYYGFAAKRKDGFLKCRHMVMLKCRTLLAW